LAVLLAGGLVFRLLIVLSAPAIDQDQALHCTVARHVLEGRWAYKNSNGYNFYSLQESGLSPYNHPLFHLATAGAAMVIGNIEKAARSVSFAAGLGVMIILYLAARLLLPTVWALVVLAMVALHPGLAYLSATAYAESLYLFWLSVAVWCLAALWRGGPCWRLVVGTGVAVGLAALTKPEGALLAPLYAIFVAIVAGRQSAAWPRLSWARGALGFLVVLALVQAALFPYRLYFRFETGRWKPVSKSLYTLIVAERYRSVSRREAFFGLNETRTDTVLADRVSRETLREALALDWPWLLPTMARNAMKNLERLTLVNKDWAGPALLLAGAAAAVRG
jgi:4-amino-4-deoxy-L-arabinose transferase-like glycosyltransferase